MTALDMSAEEKHEAPQLEPAFEALLRSGNIHEDVTMACRVQDIPALLSTTLSRTRGQPGPGVLTQLGDCENGEGLEQRESSS